MGRNGVIHAHLLALPGRASQELYWSGGLEVNGEACGLGARINRVPQRHGGYGSIDLLERRLDVRKAMLCDAIGLTSPRIVIGVPDSRKQEARVSDVDFVSKRAGSGLLDWWC